MNDKESLKEKFLRAFLKKQILFLVVMFMQLLAHCYGYERIVILVSIE